ncbi:hypothetical protein CGMCC3_g8739 [Colletotrichum fructicola]|nr:uncharacterized protein CGMCC3_g8739 [Colletotrichum fructicola]KAE9575321.1 hypothetical protein CGMCC3_g8739 [Colletotrichum fructicola]
MDSIPEVAVQKIGHFFGVQEIVYCPVEESYTVSVAFQQSFASSIDASSYPVEYRAKFCRVYRKQLGWVPQRESFILIFEVMVEVNLKRLRFVRLECE